MSLTLDASAQAAIIASARGAHWLVELDFTGGTVRYTTNALSLTISGNTYTGLGNMADVVGLTESENTTVQKITLGFSIADKAVLAATIGNVESYRWRPMRVYLQLMDATFQPVGAPVQRFAGYMEAVSVKWERADPAGGPRKARLEMPCSRAGTARARHAQGLRLTHAQQLERFPGDMGLQYLQDLVERPALWQSVNFQRQD